MVRFKNRALLVKVHFLDKAPGGLHLSAPILHEALRKACNQILGVKSTALISNLRVKYVNFAIWNFECEINLEINDKFRYVNCWTGLAVITVRKTELVNLRSAIPFVAKLEHGKKGSRGVILQEETLILNSALSQKCRLHFNKI